MKQIQNSYTEMPWRVVIEGPGAAIAVTAIVASTLSGQSLWNRLKSSITPHATAATAAATSAVQPAKELFSDKDFAYIQASCKRGSAKASTDYGEWHAVKNCTLPARGRRSLTLPLEEVLYNDQNKVVGFKRMLVTDVRRNFYEKNLTSSVTEESKTSAKFGQRIFPLVVVVKKDLCESLAYNQV